jgi:hypothetical protein
MECETVLKRDVMHRVSEGLKARKSLAQGNALCHGRQSTLEAPTGRSRIKSGRTVGMITPLQGLANVMCSIRRALPCAIDDRAFSPYESFKLLHVKNFASL